MSLSLILQAYDDDNGDEDTDWETAAGSQHRPAKIMEAIDIDNVNVCGGSGQAVDSPMPECNHSLLKAPEVGTYPRSKSNNSGVKSPTNKRLKRTGNWMWASKSRRRSTRLNRISASPVSSKTKRISSHIQTPNSTNNDDDAAVEHEDQTSPPFSPISEEGKADQDEENLIDDDDEDDEPMPALDYHGPPGDNPDQSLRPLPSHLVSEKESFKCPYCLQKYCGREELIKHLRTSHNPYFEIQNQQPEADKSSQSTKQQIIDSTSSNFAGDRIRSLKVSPLTPHKVARKNASTRSYRSPWKCQHCDAAFNLATNLKRHMKVHEDTDRPWKCSKCPSFFMNSTQLRIHENRVHGRSKGQSLFPCKVCGRKLKRSHLVDHMTFHSQQRPFSCPKCTTRFKLVAPLKKHLKRCHGTEKSHQELRSSKLYYTPKDVVGPIGQKVKIGKAKSPLMKMGIHKSTPQSDSDQKQMGATGGRETLGNSHKCHLCTFESATKGNLKRHMSVHKEESIRPWKCSACKAFFKTSSSLALHENLVHNRHQGKSKFPCPVCPSKFSRTKLQAHMLTHTQVKPFACPSCGRRFGAVSNLKRHLLTVHGENWSRSELTSDYSTGGQNTETSSNEGDCNQDDLNSKHPDQMENNLRDDVVAGNKKKLAFRCPYCFAVFLNGNDLVAHLDHHKKTDRPGRSFFGNKDRNLDREISANCHVVQNKTSGNWKRHQCTICQKGFAEPSKLVVHMRVHSGAKPFSCFRCPHRFRQSCHLKKHLMSRHGLEQSESELKILQENATSHKDCIARFKLRPCRIILTRCDNRLPSDSNSSPISTSKVGVSGTIKHVTSCNDKKDSFIRVVRKAGKCQYECKACSKIFPDKLKARRHVVGHMNLREYQCGQCSKRFLYKQNLVRHERTHLGEKPHRCHKCGKAFALNENLKRHILSVHEGEKGFQCSICGRGLSSKRNLQKHDMIHNRKKNSSNADTVTKSK